MRYLQLSWNSAQFTLQPAPHIHSKVKPSSEQKSLDDVALLFTDDGTNISATLMTLQVGNAVCDYDDDNCHYIDFNGSDDETECN